jgi:hypothetical protein
VSGVATFSDLQVNQNGTYDLLAEAAEISTAYPPARVVSAAFTISDSTHTLVAADIGGEFFGFQEGIDGSITPTTISILGGATIAALGTNVIEAPPDATILLVNGSFTQSAFTSLTMNGITLLTSAADGFLQGAVTRWRWDNTIVLTAAGTYPVTIA